MRALCVSAAVVLALLLAGAATAQAATLRGFTHRGLNVKVTTDAKGRVKEAVFNWHVRRCDSGRFRFDTSTAVTTTGPPLAHIRTDNPYTLKSRGGFRSRVTTHTRGRRLSIYRWSGSFSAVAIIRRHGKVVDRCHFRRVSWTASMPEIHLTMSSDPGEYILGGNSYSFSSPKTRFGIESQLEEYVSVYVPDFSLTFRAPFNKTLKPGHFKHALREGSNGKHGGLLLSASGRVCEKITGEFTIRRAVFRDDELKRFNASFVQYCDGSSVAARGTFTYRR
jgi:hypothetical protein